jgi:malonyl-CoA O-methyltransferase
VVLDLGAGTGQGTRALRARYRRSLVVACDIAPGMLVAARAQMGFRRRFERVCADAYRLPLADASVDLIFSSLMLQWCDELDAVIRELRRVLRPGGVLSFSSFGPDTLGELRDAWAQADTASHVSRFLDMHDVGMALARAGFAEPVLDVDRHVLHYRDVRALMDELKAIGAGNATAGRPRGLTGRARLAAMTGAYERRRSAQGLPATWEVVYGMAWGGAERPAHPPGERVVPVSRIGRRVR